jgi:AcrR family transcriptional regulator
MPMSNESGEAGTRARILEAASKLLMERGYARTTVREIAAEVGISNPSLYHHFASKGEILAELLAEPLARVEEALARAAGLRGVDRARCIIGGMLDALEIHSGATMAAFRIAGELPEPYRELALAMRPHIMEMLSDGVADDHRDLRLTMAIAAVDGAVADLMRVSKDDAAFTRSLRGSRDAILELAIGILRAPVGGSAEGT